MAFKSVQFWGCESVLQAYKLRAVPAWSLWCDKLLNYAYEGDCLEDGYEALENYLKLMGRATNAVYTLKIHRELKDGELINEKTVSNGAFNFKMAMDEQSSMQPSVYLRNTETDQRLTKIEKLLEGESSEDDDIDEDDTIGKVQKLIESPIISGILGKFFNLDTSSIAASGGKISGIHNERQLQDGLAILKKHDGQLSKHIWLLAQIAETDLKKFQGLMMLLDNMEIKPK